MRNALKKRKWAKTPAANISLLQGYLWIFCLLNRVWIVICVFKSCCKKQIGKCRNGSLQWGAHFRIGGCVVICNTTEFTVLQMLFQFIKRCNKLYIWVDRFKHETCLVFHILLSFKNGWIGAIWFTFRKALYSLILILSLSTFLP